MLVHDRAGLSLLQQANQGKADSGPFLSNLNVLCRLEPRNGPAEGFSGALHVDLGI